MLNLYTTQDVIMFLDFWFLFNKDKIKNVFYPWVPIKLMQSFKGYRKHSSGVDKSSVLICV